MAEELGIRRNNHQCRTHHVKMIKRFGNLAGIIEGLLKDFEEIGGKHEAVSSETGGLEDFPKLAIPDLPVSIALQLVQEEEKSSSLFDELGGPMFSF